MNIKQDQESLIAAPKDNVKEKMEHINRLIHKNRELEDRIDLMLDCYHKRCKSCEHVTRYHKKGSSCPMCGGEMEVMKW